jgi:hypothetical protein
VRSVPLFIGINDNNSGFEFPNAPGHLARPKMLLSLRFARKRKEEEAGCWILDAGWGRQDFRDRVIALEATSRAGRWGCGCGIEN